MITLKYRVTQSQAVKHGWPTCGLVDLEIEPEEIPAELRPILASGLVYDRDRDLTDLIGDELYLSSLDQTGLISELRRFATKKQLAAAKEKATDEQAKTETEALLAWATTTGSELLHTRIQEGFAWESLARHEFAATQYAVLCAAVPELHKLRENDGLTAGETVSRTTPTLAEIGVLQAAKKALPKAACGLCWAKYSSKDGKNFTRTELWVIVTAPDGGLVDQSFGFESASDTRHKATVTAD